MATTPTASVMKQPALVAEAPTGGVALDHNALRVLILGFINAS